MPNNDLSKRYLHVLISGGGTGGHIFPALSIANALRRRYPGAEILFVGAEGRMEMQRVPDAGYRIMGLPVAGFDRKRLWRNVKVLARLFNSMRMARHILRDFNPDIVVGVGGYASGPVLKAAQRKGIPTVIQEQNSYAGVTNRLLASRAKAICTAYDNMDRFFPADRITKTGNPVRYTATTHTPAEARKALGLDPERKMILVTGGSLGARTINDSIAAGLDSINASGATMLWQTGKLYYDRYAPLAEGYGNVKCVPFISDMDLAYSAADLVVSRAGAGTISELQILGKPAVLVPSPNVAEDHQRKNALALTARRAAVMITDADAASSLVASVTDLIDSPARLDELARNIKAMAMADADNKIVDIIERVLLADN